MKLRENTYPVNLYFKIKPNLDEDMGSDFDGLCSKEGKKITIYLKKLEDIDDIAILTHEATHAIDFIQEVIEGEIDGESRAYLMQSIIKQILDRYMKEGKNGRKKS